MLLGSLALEEDLERFAPILVQEVTPGYPWAGWDCPVPLDPDRSGTLADDFRYRSVSNIVPYYATARADSGRLYLFYGVYYAVDWSGDPQAPRIDHAGDFEGALVIISRSRHEVEAVITQAHKRYYLWRPESNDAGASGRAALPIEDGHAVLFSESGGHGLYAWFRGSRWAPKGGRYYPDGPAAAPPEATLWIVVDRSLSRILADQIHREARAVIRPLSEITPFVDPRHACFKNLPSGAMPVLRENPVALLAH